MEKISGKDYPRGGILIVKGVNMHCTVNGAVPRGALLRSVTEPAMIFPDAFAHIMPFAAPSE
jgi:hypothetical protein